MQSLVARGPRDGRRAQQRSAGKPLNSHTMLISTITNGTAAIGVAIKNIANQPLFREFPGPHGVSKCGDGVPESLRE
ncbi:hypothetical protein QF025_004111 [Paraburkholderia graminis]|uniref:Uncharacterized protein n=1 Tax=Paraburkholderia graminis TaxID=60548 RepID=A0ABD5CJ95_9BURK|nr:hypothetical protein [Paraburkholderia graminis]